MIFLCSFSFTSFLLVSFILASIFDIAHKVLCCFNSYTVFKAECDGLRPLAKFHVCPGRPTILRLTNRTLSSFERSLVAFRSNSHHRFEPGRFRGLQGAGSKVDPNYWPPPILGLKFLPTADPVDPDLRSFYLACRISGG